MTDEIQIIWLLPRCLLCAAEAIDIILQASGFWGGCLSFGQGKSLVSFVLQVQSGKKEML